jgi:hypothetical protein
VHLLCLKHETFGSMPDTTIKNVEADSSPKGEMGQRYLVAASQSLQLADLSEDVWTGP